MSYELFFVAMVHDKGKSTAFLQTSATWNIASSLNGAVSHKGNTLEDIEFLVLEESVERKRILVLTLVKIYSLQMLTFLFLFLGMT